MQITKAVILAAGRGSRLGSLTDSKPKSLNKVGGLTFLEWQIGALRQAGVKDIVVVTGYEAHFFEAFPVRRLHNPDWSKTNMFCSLLCASGEFNETVIVSYSDILYDAATVQALDASQGDIAITYDKEWRALWEKRFKNPLDDAESFLIGAEGRMLEIGKKTKNIAKIQGQYMGLLKFTPKGWSQVIEWVQKQPDVSRMDMTTLLQKLIEQGHPVHAAGISNSWMEIDSPEDLKLAEQLFQEGKLKPAISVATENI